MTTIYNEVPKVAILVPSLRPVGPVNVAVAIAQYCRNKDLVDITLVSLRRNKSQDLKNVKALGLNVKEMHFRKIPSLRQLLMARKSLRNYDIIHAHCILPTMIIAGIKTKRITTIHNNPYIDYIYEYGYLIGASLAHLQRYLIKSYDRTISISAYVDSIMKLNNSKIIYNGITDRGKTNKYDSGIGSFKIVCISSLTKRKNIFELLDVILYCIEQGMKIECTIIGEGPQLDKLKKYAQSLGLVNSVNFKGQLDREKTYAYLDSADCLVHTSLSEGFGLVIAEAYMHSKPVIVKNIPVMHEIVQDGQTGYIYSSKKEFHDSLTKIYLNKKLKQSLGSNARNYYEDNFTNNIMSHKYYNEYTILGAKSQEIQ